MTCIKTGAFVYFDEYGFATAADIFQVEQVAIIQWNTNGLFFGAFSSPDMPRRISHSVRLGVLHYHHKDRGVTAVHISQIKEIKDDSGNGTGS